MHETARETSYCKSTEILEVVTRNSHERRMLTTDGGIVGIDAFGNVIIVYRDKTLAMFTALHVRQYARVSRNVEPHTRQIYNVFVSICVMSSHILALRE